MALTEPSLHSQYKNGNRLEAFLADHMSRFTVHQLLQIPDLHRGLAPLLSVLALWFDYDRQRYGQLEERQEPFPSVGELLEPLMGIPREELDAEIKTEKVYVL